MDRKDYDEPRPHLVCYGALLIAVLGTFTGTIVLFFLAGALAAGQMVNDLVPHIAQSGAIWGAIGVPVISGITKQSNTNRQVASATWGAAIWAVLTSLVFGYLTHALMI
jgi:hypothetical protein